MKLRKRDLEIFKMIDKFRILDVISIMKLCDFSDYVYCTRKLKILYDLGYIDKYRKDIYTPLVYFMKQKGMNMIHEPKAIKDSKKLNYKSPSKIALNNIFHELEVIKVVLLLLEHNKDISIDDIELDREMKSKQYKKTKKHIPDIRIEKYNTVLELELNKKNKENLIKNIQSNSFNYQIWIVPQSKTSLQNTILNIGLMQENTVVEVISLENIDKIKINLSEKYDRLIKENSDLLNIKNKIKELKEEQLQLNFK